MRISMRCASAEGVTCWRALDECTEVCVHAYVLMDVLMLFRKVSHMLCTDGQECVQMERSD